MKIEHHHAGKAYGPRAIGGQIIWRLHKNFRENRGIVIFWYLWRWDGMTSISL